MITIYIKSFNRPFYLERCLKSLKQLVTGEISITILDDGTPEKYLQRIKEKYPVVTIVTSKNFQKKNNAIEENLKTGKEINGFEIPTNLWIEEIKKGPEYVLITEEDVWFTQPINLDQLVLDAQKHDVQLLKLGWLGNKQDDVHLEIYSINEYLESIRPKNLFLSNPFIMDAFFKNKFKFFTILYKLGKVDNFTQSKYWALNSILMGFYKKEYWLEIWKGMDGKVDEKKQLANASSYYKNHQSNKNFISRIKTEAMKTTFQSSATNSYHKYGNDFDVNLFNHQINEAWYGGSFDALQNFPKDFTLDYFEQFLDDRINKIEFRNWVSNFRKHYKDIGSDVEN